MNCRICYDEISHVNYYCNCKYDNAYIHKSCLIKWLNISENSKCEICNFPYHIKHANKNKNKIYSTLFLLLNLLLLIIYFSIIILLKNVNLLLITIILISIELLFLFILTQLIQIGIIDIYTISNPRTPIVYDRIQSELHSTISII